MLNKRLYLLRHAQAHRAADAGLRDFERPLTEFGASAATAMGGHFARKAYSVDLVLCSPSRRTRETCDGFLKQNDERPQSEYPDVVYEAGIPSLLNLLRETDAATRALLLIGHNPGIAGLAVYLARPEGGLAYAHLVGEFSAGSLAVFDLPTIEWAEMGEACARLVEFTRPQDLVLLGG